MSLTYVAVSDFPRGMYMLDDQSPHKDYSGYEHDATSPWPTNLSTNPGVEVDQWWYANNSEWTRFIDTSVKHSGNQSVRFHHNQSARLGATMASLYAVGGGQLTITPNTTYGYGVWIMSSVPATAKVILSWFIDANNFASQVSTNPLVTLTPNTWTWVSVKGDSPANATRLWPSLEVVKTGGSNAGPTDYVWFDDALIVKQPTANWEPHTRFGPALCKGATQSLIVSDSQRLSVPSTVFKKNKEYLPFSIGAFFRPIIEDPADTDEIQILGNDGAMDGLTIKGTVVSFVTKYTATGEARASFDLLDYQSTMVYGVHTRTKNQLFVGGDLVAEVEITAAQQADTYATTGSNLASGQTTSPNKLMLNGVCLYDIALDEDSIIAQFAHGQDTLGAEDVALAFGGSLLEFGSDAAISPFFQITYSSDAEWKLGQNYNISQHDGTLYPVQVNNTSQSGYWETVVPLGYAPNTIYSANLLWEGTGATVTTSLDGINWSPAAKGKALTTVTKGMNGEGRFLFIRVTFPGGVVADPAYFDNMVFSLYSFGTPPLYNGREVVLDKVSLEDDTDVIDLHENWGAELQSGTLTIKSATGTVTPKTIEVWGKRGAVGATFTDNLTGADASYSNGGTFKAYSADEWQVRHYVFNSGFTGDITFTGTGQIGHVILYPDAKSAATVAEIYKCYVGKPKVSLSVSEVFDIKEFAGAVDIYEYDWTIESSG